MTSPLEEVSPPEWLIRLENKEKPHRLAHEIGAGSPCLKCGENCPGLDLHFWRKLCRNCKCRKEDHDIVEDDTYSHFKILFGPSLGKNIGIQPKKAVLELLLKNGKKHSVPLDWTPPNAPVEVVKDYLERLPQNKIPINKSPGGIYRRQQLEKQIPLHDFDPNLCHQLSPTEAKQLEAYAINVRNNVIGQARLVRVPVVRGYTSSSTEVPPLLPFRSSNVIRNDNTVNPQNVQCLECGNSRKKENDHVGILNYVNKNKAVFPQENCVCEYGDAKYNKISNPHHFTESSIKLSQPEFSQNITSTCPKNSSCLPFSDDIFSDSRKAQSAGFSKDPKYNHSSNMDINPVGSNSAHMISNSNLNDKFNNANSLSEPSKLEADSQACSIDPEIRNCAFSRNLLPSSYVAYSTEQNLRQPSFSGKVSLSKSSTPNISCGHSKYNIEQSQLENSENMTKIKPSDIDKDVGKILGRLENSNLISNSTELNNYANNSNLDNKIGTCHSGNDFYENVKAPAENIEQFDLESDEIYPKIYSHFMKEIINCTQCDGLIEIGSIAVVVQKKGKMKAWHPECFICATCEELLVDLLYFYYKGKVYCGRDYAKLCNIPRCYACDELIFMKSYTQAEGQSFHLRHFCCLECDTALADEDYLPIDGHPICLPCYNKHYAEHCHRCGEVIPAMEKTVRLNDLSWHANGNCFACAYCKNSLINCKFTLKSKQPFCNQTCVRSYHNA